MVGKYSDVTCQAKIWTMCSFLSLKKIYHSKNGEHWETMSILFGIKKIMQVTGSQLDQRVHL